MPRWAASSAARALHIRPFFAYRARFSENSAASSHDCVQCRTSAPRPGFILFVQTFGDLVNFNPYVHALVADGIFEASLGRFIPLPPIPEALLAERLRREVLSLLVRREAILPPLGEQMLAWRRSGFTVRQVRVAAGDAGSETARVLHAPRAVFAGEHDAGNTRFAEKRLRES